MGELGGDIFLCFPTFHCFIQVTDLLLKALLFIKQKNIENPRTYHYSL